MHGRAIAFSALLLTLGLRGVSLADGCTERCPVPFDAGDVVSATQMQICLAQCRNGPSGPAAPPKPDVWGAVAVSPSTLASGTSWNYPSEAGASAAALGNCRGRGGSDCRVVKTVADVCVALAVSNAERVFAIGGPTGAGNFADDAAMLKCQRAGGKSCFVQASLCADGERHALGGHIRFSNGNPIFIPDDPPLPTRTPSPRSSPVGDDTEKFFGTWTAEFTANGKTVRLQSDHDSDGYHNFWIGDDGRVPAGSGTFTAAHGEYQTSAPAPNDKGTYRFVDSQTVMCANAAGQQLTWRRQTAPRSGRIDANTAAKDLINYSPPSQRPGVIKK